MNENKANINWFPGHINKTRNELKEKIKLVDIVFEVIDARMPISSKIIDIDTIIKNKNKILVVTKYDLCDKQETDKLLDYYVKNDYKVVKVDLKNNKGIDKLKAIIKESNDELNKIRHEKGLKDRIPRALIVGVPNVGKSTLINRLVGRKSAIVGDKPGVTKILSWIRTNNIELLDSPGILWPKIDNERQGFILLLFKAMNETLISNKLKAYFILDILKELYPDNLKKRYNLNNIIDNEEIIENIGINRKVLTNAKNIDYNKVYDIIVSDFNNNYFGTLTLDR